MPIPDEELTEVVVRRLAADLPRNLQNRLTWSFDYYFRPRRQSARAESLLHLHAFTMTDGVRTYRVAHTDAGWALEVGGTARGRHSVDGRGETRIPQVYRAIHRSLSEVRVRLRGRPLATSASLATARQRLRELLSTETALLRDVTVVTLDGELVLAVQRGRAPRALSQPAVSWRAFCRGGFPPGAVARELTAHLFQVSPSTVEKTRGASRRKS